MTGKAHKAFINDHYADPTTDRWYGFVTQLADLARKSEDSEDRGELVLKTAQTYIDNETPFDLSRIEVTE